ncbi:MAG: glycosyl transferase group 1 [Sphingobacteriaceae bacterium]|jgi:glycosyltransferase involved in cell wall biosynthesis|nr:glycosyl transferase group 1 [Sphingobacteriaceae bacterium]
MNKYVLVLPSWYPSRVDRFNGDFNERLVVAASAECKHVVLYVVKDPSISKVEIIVSRKVNVTTYTVYYPTTKIPLIRSVHNMWQYLSLNRKYLKEIIDQKGKPQIINCQVLFPAVFAAKFALNSVGAPIVITEHWTAFYRENPHSLWKANRAKRILFTRLLRSVDHIIPVAQRLGTEIKRWAPNVPQTIIPNVVDVGIFNCPGVRPRGGRFVFLHVSTMKYQKNTDGLLKAFEKLLCGGASAELHLVGELPRAIRLQIESSELLKKCVISHGEVEYPEVAELMKSADCFVMFSRYENLPCVILEGLCCGLPMVATDVGGIREVVNDENGILVSSENEEACFKAMLEIVEGIRQFDRTRIAAEARAKFSYKAVGKQIAALYSRLGTELEFN